LINRKGNDLRFNFDESGSITTSDKLNNRFFIVAGCQTNDPNKVKRIFRKAKVNYLKHHPELELDIKKEIKGSQMPLDFKDYIFTELMKKQISDLTSLYLIITMPRNVFGKSQI
jgi:gp21 protein